jgi:hypothetical protein
MFAHAALNGGIPAQISKVDENSLLEESPPSRSQSVAPRVSKTTQKRFAQAEAMLRCALPPSASAIVRR